MVARGDGVGIKIYQIETMERYCSKNGPYCIQCSMYFAPFFSPPIIVSIICLHEGTHTYSTNHLPRIYRSEQLAAIL